MTAPAGTAEAPPVSAMSRRGVLPALQLALLVIVLAVVFAWMGPAQFVNALTLGAIYALIALGYTMVYGIIELINFAHGDVFMVGDLRGAVVPHDARVQRRDHRLRHSSSSCSWSCSRSR